MLGLVLRLSLLSLLSFTAAGDTLYETVDDWPWSAAAFSFAALIVLVDSALHTPLAFWRGYVHERRWGFSTQTLNAWALDRLKGVTVAVVLTALPLFALIASVHLLPRWWPLVAAAGAAVLVLLVGFVAPVVLWDTLLARGDSGEIRLVVAHELGHRRFRHVARWTTISMASVAVFVVLMWALAQWDPLLAAVGADGPGDARLLPIVLLLGSGLEVVLQPVANAISRRWERDCDRFSLELTRDPQAYERTHRLLAIENLADLSPPKSAYLFFASHPTASERLAAGRAWSSQHVSQ